MNVLCILVVFLDMNILQLKKKLRWTSKCANFLILHASTGKPSYEMNTYHTRSPCDSFTATSYQPTNQPTSLQYVF